MSTSDPLRIQVTYSLDYLDDVADAVADVGQEYEKRLREGLLRVYPDAAITIQQGEEFGFTLDGGTPEERKEAEFMLDDVIARVYESLT
jgi:hypothetical protein